MNAGDSFTPSRSEHVFCEVGCREQQALACRSGTIQKMSKGSYRDEIKAASITQRFKRRTLEHVRIPSVTGVSKRGRKKQVTVSMNLIKAATGGDPSRKCKPCASRRLVRFSSAMSESEETDLDSRLP